MDQKLPSANPSGQQAHRKCGHICPMELWDGKRPNVLITVQAFFQVFFQRILLFAEERKGPEEENEEHAFYFLALLSFEVFLLVQRMRKMIV